LGVTVIGASARSAIVCDYLARHPRAGWLVGFFDTVPARAEFLRRKFGANDARVFPSLEAAVTDPRAAAVFVGTPDYAHTAPVLAALRAGKHVYCEKPLAITQGDLDAICRAAERADTVFYLGMNLRHTPVHEKMHALLTSGRLGRLIMIEANEYYQGGRTYFRRWNRLRRFSGGLWVTKACHDFDILNWFAGGNPVRVFASCSLSHYRPRPDAGPDCRHCRLTRTCPDYYDVRREPPEYQAVMELTDRARGFPRDLCLYNSDKDTFDNGMAIVEYDNGVRASYALSVVCSRDTRQLRLTGTDGSAEGDLESGLVTFWERYGRRRQVWDLRTRMQTAHAGADERILTDFFRCCRTGAMPRTGALDGRRSVMLGLAATRSCDTGRPVPLDTRWQH